MDIRRPSTIIFAVMALIVSPATLGIVCFVSEGNDLYMTYTAYILIGIAGIIVLIRGINNWKRGNIMTIEKTLKAVSEKLKNAPVNTDYADSLLLIKNALEKQRMCEWTKDKNTLGKSACKTTALLGKTVWIIMLTNIISQGKPVYHIREAICTKYSVGMYGEVTISTVTKDERKTRNETPLTAIGDTIFLSKEDAEIKLKEMRK